jgi:hypothetical protein
MAEPAKKAHWRALTETNSNNFTFGDILEINPDGADLTVQVVSAKGGVVEGNLDGKMTRTRKVILTFVGIKRPLGLNPTNARTIAGIYGTPYPADWEAQQIKLTLYATKTKLKGEIVDCVRIRPVKPAANVPVYGVASGNGATSPAPDFDLDGWLAAIADCPTREEFEQLRADLNGTKRPASAREPLAKAIESARVRLFEGGGA